MYHKTLGLRVIQKKKKGVGCAHDAYRGELVEQERFWNVDQLDVPICEGNALHSS